MIPSSVKVGVRPSIATSRRYSSSLSPCSPTSAGVIAGSPTRGATAVILRRHAGENRLQKTDSIVGAEQRTAGALRVRHHAQHVAVLADDSRDVALGPVGVGVRADVPAGVRIPEDNPAFGLECIEYGGLGEVASVPVGYGELQKLARPIKGREQRV